VLTSVTNPLVKQVVALQRRKERDEAGLFVIEGRRFVAEALRRGAPLQRLYYCPDLVGESDWEALAAEARARNVTCEEVSAQVFRKMSGTEGPQGVLAVAAHLKRTWTDIRLGPADVLLVIDGLQDPGNLGTILRTALAAGVTQVVLTRGTVDLYNQKVLRSTMGVLFDLVILTEAEADEVLRFCRERVLPLVTADVRGEEIYHTEALQPPLALVVGNEGNGPCQVLREGAERLVRIPMAGGVESLNVAIATGILLYEIARHCRFL